MAVSDTVERAAATTSPTSHAAERDYTRALTTKASWVDPAEWIIADVCITIQRLGIAQPTAEAVGGNPASELGRVLAEPGVVEGGFGVALQAGKFVGGDAGVSGVDFAKRQVIEVLHDGLVEAGEERPARARLLRS